MLSALLLATSLALAPVASITVNFTSDSVYTNDTIVKPKDVIEEDSGLYTIVLEEDKLLGYTIFDNSETEYIDGLKFDNEFVTNWTVEHVDLSKEHSILVKTVYTDDIAGTLAAAKDGDWSRMLSNPLIILQLFYYILAAVSLIVGGVGLVKAKMKKLKDREEIAALVKTAAINSGNALKEEALGIVDDIVHPILNTFKTSQDNMIKAFIMSQSGDKNSTLGLIDMLNESASSNMDEISESIKKAINAKFEMKEKAKEEADKAVKQIAKGIFKEESEDKDTDKDTDVGGIAI